MQKRLLIVDDEPAVLNALKRIFRRQDYQIRLANSGTEALAALQEQVFQVVLSDVRMPDMSGDQLMLNIQQSFPGVVGVLLTGHAEMSAVIRVLNAGAVYRFLEKPWQDQHLLENVADAFEHWDVCFQQKSRETFLRDNNGGIIELDADKRLIGANSMVQAALPRSNLTPGATCEEVLVSLQPEQVRYLFSGEGQNMEVQDKLNDQVLALQSKSVGHNWMLAVEPLFQMDSLALPGLLSRQEVILQLQKLLSSPAPDVTVVSLDINGFRRFNDSLGYQKADQLLAKIAQLLLDNKPENAWLGRMSGDEFVLLISQQLPALEVYQVIEKLLAPFASLLSFDHRELHISFRAGYAVGPSDGPDADQLLRNAQVTASNASRGPRKQFNRYQVEMNAHDTEFASLQSDLYRSLERDELYVLYQPKVSLKDGRIAGAEVLLRWQHELRGTVSPEIFIPMAEETGLIEPIGDWVLAAASAQKKIWQAQGVQDFVIAVNMSGRQLEDYSLLQKVRDLIAQNQLQPAQIELEITETFLMQDISHSIMLLEGLKDLGVRLAIDDFGTGYSSLKYLNDLPVDTLKIDRSFVMNIASSQDAYELVKNMIRMSHDLGKHVVAEGVENHQQLAVLEQLGCDEIQGFFYSPPVSADNFRLLLDNQPIIGMDFD